jgi:hypothetical protein
VQISVEISSERSKVGRGAQMDASLLDEVVIHCSDGAVFGCFFSGLGRDCGPVLAKAGWGSGQ